MVRVTGSLPMKSDSSRAQRRRRVRAILRRVRGHGRQRAPRALYTLGPMDTVDALIHARWIIPVEPEGRVLEHHALAVHHGRIVALLSSAEAKRRFRAQETVELPQHALIPGLVNAHTHAAMTLLRGLADDLPLMRWLKEY